MAAALKTLRLVAGEHNRTIAVLGAMSELGEYAGEEYDRLALLSAASNLQLATLDAVYHKRVVLRTALRIDEIAAICAEYDLALIEDAAESLGSYYKGRHTGTFGLLGTFSFNGNKTVTAGGGGMLVTDDEALAAFHDLCRLEGIIPALESSHALAYAAKIAPRMKKEQILLVNLSGRGDKDMHTVAQKSGLKFD